MTDAPHPNCQLPDVGSIIPGSRYLRDYCGGCGEPMRVIRTHTDEDVRVLHYCEKCEPNIPPAGTGLTARQAAKLREMMG